MAVDGTAALASRATEGTTVRRKLGVGQRVGPEGGEDAHLLLGVMEGVEPPEGPEPVIGPVGQSATAVHGHDADPDGHPTGKSPHRREDEPGDGVAEAVGETDPDEDDQRDDGHGVEKKVKPVLDMTPGQQRPEDGGPEPFGQKAENQEAEDDRTDQLIP